MNEYFYIEFNGGKKYIRTNNKNCQVLVINTFTGTEVNTFDKPYPVDEETTISRITRSEFVVALFKHVGKKVKPTV